MKSTYTDSEIKSAIARSISHNEIVRVTSADPGTTLDLLDNDSGITELNSATEDDCSLDIWGKMHGEDFRIRLQHTEMESENTEDAGPGGTMIANKLREQEEARLNEQFGDLR